MSGDSGLLESLVSLKVTCTHSLSRIKEIEASKEVFTATTLGFVSWEAQV